MTIEGRKVTRNVIQNDSLERIASEVIGCPLCKLSRTRKNAVPGQGQVSAKIMFIGEAPGKNEDLKGKPFVGAAGRILDQAMEKAGIDRSMVFITNVVKCRPPSNRIPDEDERIACRPYLQRQISLISPKIICILGNTAYSSILGGKSITASRGKIVKKDGQRYFLTVHPAAAIYNMGLRSVFEKDLFKLSDEIKRIENAQQGDSLLSYTKKS
ncbi:MAG: uracil-DNA glycosylase family protein [Nitrososphaeraceae archaeon]|jgi:uracil-DNA glycosylase